ncbi:MAG: metal-dependent hydrolase [Candidatus Micrarchaeota archaeon]
MRFRTHLAFGILCGLFALPFVKGIHWIVFFALVMLGSLFPDIDHPQSKIGRKVGFVSKLANTLGGHRGMTHSAFFLVGLPLLVGYLFGYVYGLAFFIGYLSHLLIDSVNPKGINYLNPITTLRMHGFIETGSAGEMVVLVLLIMVIGLKLLKVF